MNITGLNQDNYYINNPILFEITELDPLTAYVEIVITDQTNPWLAYLDPVTYKSRPLRIYPYQNKVRYNLQEIIKGRFSEPNHPEEPFDGMEINTNYRKFAISIMEIQGIKPTTQITDGAIIRTERGRGDTVETFTGDVKIFGAKTFIRGGNKNALTNQTAKRGEILSPVEQFPRWGGYPLATYTLDAAGKIIYHDIVPSTRTEQRKIIGCDPLYLRFLNSRGGYSFWLFETIEERTIHKSGSEIQNWNSYQHTGFELQRSISAETRVQQRFVPIIEDLMKSPEIHLYNRYGLTWCRTILETNEFRFNNYETVHKVPLVFKILQHEKPSVTW